jgi:hypothetical protein
MHTINHLLVLPRLWVKCVNASVNTGPNHTEPTPKVTDREPIVSTQFTY